MSQLADPTTGRRPERAERRLRALLAGLALLLGFLQTWAHRYAVWGDLLSYLEIGEAYLHGRWSDALSAHWSPLYSWVLGSVLAIFRPSPEHEILGVKAVNLLIYVFNVAAFDLLLRQLLRRLREGDSAAVSRAPALPDWVLAVSGYAVFAWASLKWLVVFRDTPDLQVAGFVYVAAALALRAGRTEGRRDAIALGLILGLGYLAKTVMFPLAFWFLGAFALGTRRGRRGRRAGVALAAFLAVSAPYAAVLSAKLQRPTIGESGRLNYAWLVNPEARDIHWQGEPPGSGTPLHPTRKVFAAPDVYEFATPIAGTYPVWYDPFYWNQGLAPGFDLQQELRMVGRNLAYCYHLFGQGLLAGFLLAAALGGRLRASLGSLAGHGAILVPGLGGVLLFVVATQLKAEQPPWGYLQTRYMGPFVVLLFLSALASVRVFESGLRRRAPSIVILAASVAALLDLAASVSRDVADAWAQPPVHTHWQVAAGLRDLGLAPQSRVAIVGDDICYWARLARVKVVVQVEARGFWTAGEAARAAALVPATRIGVRALVATPSVRGSKRPKALSDRGWTPLGSTDYFALRLGP